MPKVELKCIDHPKYAGTRIPRVECIVCWKIYAANLRIKLKAVKK